MKRLDLLPSYFPSAFLPPFIPPKPIYFQVFFQHFPACVFLPREQSFRACLSKLCSAVKKEKADKDPICDGVKLC